MFSMPFGTNQGEIRKERLKDLLQYAHEIYRPGLPAKFLKSPLRGFAMMKWRVSRVTAWDYADTVLTVLEYEIMNQKKEREILAENR